MKEKHKKERKKMFQEKIKSSKIGKKGKKKIKGGGGQALANSW